MFHIRIFVTSDVGVSRTDRNLTTSVVPWSGTITSQHSKSCTVDEIDQLKVTTVSLLVCINVVDVSGVYVYRC